MNFNITDFDLHKLTKTELLTKCKELGIVKCKSKNKTELIYLINDASLNTTTTKIIINNISPLRYPGGKTRACKIIDNIISEHFDISQFNTLCSPFFGGGSFEFYFQNKYKYKLIVNDKFTPLFNFWKQIKTNKIFFGYTICKRIFSGAKKYFLSVKNAINLWHYVFIIFYGTTYLQ